MCLIGRVDVLEVKNCFTFRASLKLKVTFLRPGVCRKQEEDAVS